jgi:hypothetical protein
MPQWWMARMHKHIAVSDQRSVETFNLCTVFNRISAVYYAGAVGSLQTIGSGSQQSTRKLSISYAVL